MVTPEEAESQGLPEAGGLAGGEQDVRDRLAVGVPSRTDFRCVLSRVTCSSRFRMSLVKEVMQGMGKLFLTSDCESGSSAAL